MTAAKIAGVAIVVFLSAFTFGRISVVGTQIIPCDSSLVVYCWTQEVLGSGLALVLWHMAASLFIGWAVVMLSRWNAGQSA